MKVPLGLLIALLCFSCPYLNPFILALEGSPEMTHILLEGEPAEGLVIDLETTGWSNYWYNTPILENPNVSLRVLQGSEPSLSIRINENLVDLYSYTLEQRNLAQFCYNWRDPDLRDFPDRPLYQILFQQPIGEDLVIRNLNLEIVLTVPEMSALIIESSEVGLDWENGAMIGDVFCFNYYGASDLVIPELSNTDSLYLYNYGGALTYSRLSSNFIRIQDDHSYYFDTAEVLVTIGEIIATGSVEIFSDREGTIGSVESPDILIGNLWYEGKTLSFQEIQGPTAFPDSDSLPSQLVIDTHVEIAEIEGYFSTIEVGEDGATLPELETENLVVPSKVETLIFSGPARVNQTLEFNWEDDENANLVIEGLEHLDVEHLDLGVELAAIDFSAASIETVLLDLTNSIVTFSAVSELSGTADHSTLYLTGTPDISGLEIQTTELVYQ